MLDRIYPYRFKIFLFTLVAILFGSLVFPEFLYENILSHLIFLANLIAGIILISKRKRLMFLFIFLWIIAGLDFGSSLFNFGDREVLKFIRMGVYFLFYTVVTIVIILQIWNAKRVNEMVIMGVISGYISLGLIGFFICLSIEMFYPGSFQGLLTSISNPDLLNDSLMYYSYITMLTIGYGDVLPITQISQKASIFIGLMGQFYMVIITAIVVGKYINQSANK
jgi:voltage-gated potassium channel